MLYSSSQVGMDAGYFTLVSLLSSAISISNIFRYYFYTIFYYYLELYTSVTHTTYCSLGGEQNIGQLKNK